MDKISIIVPVYNSEEYLRRCIKSILEQSFFNFELILINDGSNDSSINIMNEFSLKDKRIKIINKNNTGVSDSRNVGLEKSTGNYITFVDSDDWLEKDCLEIMIDKMRKHNCDIAMCNYYINNGNKQIKSISKKSKKFDKKSALDIKKGYYITTVWGKMFKKSVVKNIKFNKKVYYSEDTLFYTETVLNSKNIYWINQRLYHYFINDSGAMKTKNIAKYCTDYDARKLIYDLYIKEKMPKKIQEQAVGFLKMSAVNILYECKKNKLKCCNYDEIKSTVLSNNLKYIFLNYIGIKDKIKYIYIKSIIKEGREM